MKNGLAVNSIMWDLLSVILESVFYEETNEERGYSEYDCRNQEMDNSCNNYSKKNMYISSTRNMERNISCNCKDEFELQMIKKYQNAISQDMKEKIILMYAKGIATIDVES